MKKKVAKNAFELSSLLGLNISDAIDGEMKSSLMPKICKEIKKRELTHLDVSELSGVGRTVITGIVNCPNQRVPIDRQVKVLASLGVKTELKLKKA
jgi:predicted XRE-type DNA-binding protein